MVKYTFKRLGLAVVTTIIILSLTFIFVKMLRLEIPAMKDNQKVTYFDEQVRLGYFYRFDSPQEGLGEVIDQNLANQGIYYYKVPVMIQYGSWIKNIVTKWDWGTSLKIKTNVKVGVILGERIWKSMRVNIFSVLVSVPTGIALGIWAALKKNTLTDHIISTIVMIFISIPNFVLISFILKIFCYDLGWLPSKWPPVTSSLGRKVAGYIVPVFCLSFGSICGYCRYIRAELCDVMESEYLLLARTKGLTRRQAIVRHALKNAMVPIFPSILAEFIGIFGGSMILEHIYGIAGIGDLFIKALNSKDYNVLFVDMAIFTTVSLVAGVFLDLSYGFIDPRIRMGARK